MRCGVFLLLGLFLLAFETMAQDSVEFSHQGGFYENSIDLTLTCGAPYHIRYTTNGATPTAHSTLYTELLHLDNGLYSKVDIYSIPTACDEYFYQPESVRHCITLRAAAFDAAENRVGPVVTQSYFIRALGCETHGLPVMALASDSLALFDYNTGILVPGVNFDPDNPMWTGNFYEEGREWERLVNVEFYEPNDNSGINQQAGLRTHGGTTRRQMQKGLKIYARQEYGTKRFKHKFFESIPNESFKHLVLKPFGYHWYHFGIQDHICNRMAAGLNVESIASRPMVLFLNGEYWGIYYLKEKPDAHYLEDHFGYEDTDYNMVCYWYGYQVDGDTTAFVEMMEWVKQCDLTQEDDYAKINELIDVESFIDYYCLELFIANSDWPANNMRCYQLHNGKWRWVFFDGDDGLKNMDFDVFDNATSLLNLGWPTDAQSTLMFRKLLENNDFCSRFIQRFYALMGNEFSYAVTKSYFDAAKAAVREEIPNQAERVGMPVSLSCWEKDITIVEEFLEKRVENMKHRLDDYFFVDDESMIINDIYPNPSIGDIHIKLWSSSFALSEIKVYNVMGKEVYSAKLMLCSGENDILLPCHFASGLYLLRFRNKTKRFIIQ